jgi:hypothetical protein
MDGVPVGNEVDTDKLATLTKELGDLKIVGVRPKPPGLTKSLRATEEKGINLSDASILSLRAKGFYLTRSGDLLSNQGDVRVVSDDGVAYTLRYGEGTYATGEALSAGSEENQKASDKEAATKKDKSSETGAESRYLFVTATFEPGFVPKTTTPKPLDEPLIVPAKPFARDANDPALVADVKADKEKAEKDNQDYERRLEEGKKRARELTDRFAAWYYVVPGDSFRNVALDRAKLIRPISAKPPTTPSTPGGFPGLPGGESAFPGIPGAPHP